MAVRFAAWLGIISCLFLSHLALAVTNTRLKTANGSPIFINARNYAGDADKHYMELTGDVQVIFEKQHLSCDHAVIHDDTHIIEADGHLIIESSTVHAEGERALLNYQTDEGVISNGFIQSGQVVVEGKVIHKLGGQFYKVEEGYTTACKTCPPAWSFTGSQIDAELGGYAKLKNAVFEFSHFPVIWFPYLLVPLKSERQSGFLIPSLEFPALGSSHETAVSERYFWAISRSQDATINLKNYSARGVKPMINYRYVLAPSSSGFINFATIQDKFFAGDSNNNLNGSRFFRWYLHSENHYELPENFTVNLKLKLFSDLFYPRDFPEELTSYVQPIGFPSTESRASIAKNTESTHASIDSSYNINMLSADPLLGAHGNLLTGNTDAVHRIPEIRYSIAESQVFHTPLLFHFDSDYVHFSRQGFAYDDVLTTAEVASAYTSTNGKPAPFLGYPYSNVDNSRGSATLGKPGAFNPERDIIRAGDRLIVAPEISYPFQMGKAFDIVPSVGYHFSQYTFDVSPNLTSQAPTPATDSATIPFNTSPTQGYFRERLSVRSRLGQVWELSPPLKGKPEKIKHEFEPELAYSVVSGINQSQSPFFNSNDTAPAFLQDQPISDLDFLSGKKVQFDYYDRISNRNLITASLTNKLIRKRWIADKGDYQQIAIFRISQSYDFEAATQTPHYPWSDIAATFDLRLDNFDMHSTARYYPYHNVTNNATRARISNARGNYLQLSFSESYLITPNIDDALTGWTRGLGIGFGFRSRNLNLDTSLDLGPNGTDTTYSIKSVGLVANIIPPGDCWGIRTTVVQNFGDKAPTFKFELDYKFGGNPQPAPVSTENLSDKSADKPAEKSTDQATPAQPGK